LTSRIGTAVAAGVLAVGILVGAAGTIVVRDATTPDFADHMGDMSAQAGPMGSMAGMMSMMGNADMAGMMSMMGSGSAMGPGASMTPNEHASHHLTPTPEATR
jgi:hypothetical protein